MALPKTSIHSPRGFTLLEILVVMGLIIVVAGFGLIVSFDSYRGYNFRNERDTVISVLQKARNQAINNMCFGAGCTDGKPHGVHFDHAGHYVIFQGATYATRDTTVDESIKAEDAAATVSGASDIIFTNLSGNVAAQATVTVTDASGKTSIITMEPEGRIWWTN